MYHDCDPDDACTYSAAAESPKNVLAEYQAPQHASQELSNLVWRGDDDLWSRECSLESRDPALESAGKQALEWNLLSVAAVAEKFGLEYLTLEDLTATRASWHGPRTGECTWVPPKILRRVTQVIRVNRSVMVHENSGVVAIGGDTIIDDSHRFSTDLPDRPLVKPLECLDGPLVTAFVSWGFTFQHTVQDTIDVVGLLRDDVFASNHSYTLLLQEPNPEAKSHQRLELFNLLGLKVRYASGEWRAVSSAFLVVKDKGFPNPMLGLRRIRKELKRVLQCDSLIAPDSIVFWVRPKGTTRWISNMDAIRGSLLNLAKGHGLKFHEVNPGEMTLAESLQLSCRSVGAFFPHGGAMYHALTLPRNGFVVEILPTDGMCTSGIEYFAALRLRTFDMEAKGHRDDGSKGLTVDGAIFNETIQAVNSYMMDLRVEGSHFVPPVPPVTESEFEHFYLRRIAHEWKKVPKDLIMADTPLITIVSSPRPYISSHGEYAERQLRVIFQWLVEFSGRAQIIFVESKEAANLPSGVETVCKTLGVEYSNELKQDAGGQDRLDSLFEIATARAQSDVIMLLNSDCFVGPRFAEILQRTIPESGSFLISGIRYVFPMEDNLEFNPLLESVASYAEHQIINPSSAKPRYVGLRQDMLDYFVFRKGSYLGIPPFRIGKSAWDNWLFAEAVRKKWQTISGGVNPPVLYLVHPEHDRPHQFSGAEKKAPCAHNRALASLSGGLEGGGLSNARFKIVPKCLENGDPSLCLAKNDS